MKVLVTGGSGKIGGYVLRELVGSGYAVSDYSRTPPLVEGVPFVQGDITDPAGLRDACRGQDAVVHLAAVPGPGITTADELMYVNVMGTFRLLQAAVAEGVDKVVFASSGAATGFSFQKQKIIPQYLPLDEDHPSAPQDEYGLSKLVGEATCKSFSGGFGIQTICLRINHNWYLDCAGAEVAVRSGWNKTRTVEEQWAQYRRAVQDPSRAWRVLWAFTDARDAAQAFRLALENDQIRHEVFLINGDDTCSLSGTRALVAAHYPGVPLRAPLQGHASLFSHDKATRVLGYRPQYTWRSILGVPGTAR
jgi:nucleoside-diphosphate-sugar epimerase